MPVLLADSGQTFDLPERLGLVARTRTVTYVLTPTWCPPAQLDRAITPAAGGPGKSPNSSLWR